MEEFRNSGMKRLHVGKEGLSINCVGRDQTPQNVASDQGFQCLQHLTFLGISTGSQMNLFKF